MFIEPCKPPCGYYSWHNPESQGCLMAQTAQWPFVMSMRRSKNTYRNDPFGPPDEPVYERVAVPAGLNIESAYTDRMQSWDRDKCDRAFKQLAQGGFKNSNDEQLLSFAKTYWPDLDIVAVRVIYFFNVSSGYDCPVVEVLYREKIKKEPHAP